MRLAAVIVLLSAMAAHAQPQPGGLGGFFAAWYGAFSPRSIDGLVAWYDSADSSTILLATNLVTQVDDKSDYGHHLTASGANRPTYAGDGILFDGTDDLLTRSATMIASNQPYVTIFAVINNTGGNATRRVAFIAQTGFTTISALSVASAISIEAGGRRLTANEFQSVTTPYSTNTKAIAYGHYQYADAALTVGDNLTTTNRAGGFQTAGTSQASSMDIGMGDFVTTGGAFGGTIYEVLVYHANLSTEDRLNIINYLNRKWGVF